MDKKGSNSNNVKIVHYNLMYLKGNIEKYLKIGYLNSEPFNYSLRGNISLGRKYFKD
jgi:hypothetical protein